MKTHRPITPGLTLLFLIALITGPNGGRAAAATATTFSGQATVISGQVAGIPVTFVDTGPVAAGGGHLHASLLEYPISGLPDATAGALTAEILHATVVAEGNRSRAEAVVADFALSAAGQKISAELLAARASATCNSGAATITESMPGSVWRPWNMEPRRSAPRTSMPSVCSAPGRSSKGLVMKFAASSG